MLGLVKSLSFMSSAYFLHSVSSFSFFIALDMMKSPILNKLFLVEKTLILLD